MSVHADSMKKNIYNRICIMQNWRVRPVFSKILKQICQNVSSDTKMVKLKLRKSIKDRCRCNNLNVQFSIFIFNGSYYRFKRQDDKKLWFWGWVGMEAITRGHSGPVCRWIGVVIGVIGNFLSWVGILVQCVGGLEW